MSEDELYPEIKTLFDIPTMLKEFHHIEYDAELNAYWIWGHQYSDSVSNPTVIYIESDNKISTMHRSEDIIEIEYRGMQLTLYPISMMVSIKRGD